MAYIDSGYFTPDAGYVVDVISPLSFKFGSSAICFSFYPEGEARNVSTIQPNELSTGAARFGYASRAKEKPIDIDILVTEFERVRLEEFFNSTVNGQQNTFDMVDNINGASVTVRFGSDGISDISHVGNDNYRVSLSLVTA